MYDMKPYLEKIDEVIKKGPFSDTWESLQNFRTPEWYRKAKFGIFIHWGVYSVPAFGNEWYSRNMYVQDSPEYKHHIETYGPQKDFGYKEFIPMFKAEKFNAEEWADLFEAAGAKYVVPVAEHHDGFQMYRSEISHYNEVEMGPKRDTHGELREACLKRGIMNGASSHRIEHWFFMGKGKEFDSDVKEPLQRGDFYWPSMIDVDFQNLYSEPAPSEEFMQDWLVRTCELIDNYHPRLLYFDWWIQHSAAKPYLKKLAAYYYNRAAEWGIEVAINYKHDSYMFGTAVVDIERGQLADVKPYFWQTDTSVALNSWCYTENNDYRPAEDIVRDLVDIVSKNGCLLLNIGPKADGTIPEEDKSILLAIGKWLKVNGEAIYGSRTWRLYGEGPTQVEEGQFTDSVKKDFTSQDVRYTINGNNIYATALMPSADGTYRFEAFGERDASKKPNFHGIIKGVEMLGHDGNVSWERKEEAMFVKAPIVDGSMPVVFKVIIE